MRRKVTVCLLCISWALMMDCSSSLSRPKAKGIIGAYAAFASAPSLNVAQGILWVMESCERAGLWQRPPKGGWYQLTPLGKKYFTAVQGMGYIPLVTPAKREVVEISGITEMPMGGNDVKIVQFTWRYADLPEPVLKCISPMLAHPTGQALLKLYDDGWRVEQVETKP